MELLGEGTRGELGFDRGVEGRWIVVGGNGTQKRRSMFVGAFLFVSFVRLWGKKFQAGSMERKGEKKKEKIV
jgi:hypothetical protein